MRCTIFLFLRLCACYYRVAFNCHMGSFRIKIYNVFRDKHAEQPANRTTCTDCTHSSGHSICKSVLSAFFLSQSSFHEQEKYINRTLSFYCFASAGKLSQIPHCSARPRLAGESKLLSPQQYTPVLLRVLYSRFPKS